MAQAIPLDNMSHVTLEQAKRLKDLGHDGKAEYIWHVLEDGNCSIENTVLGSIRGINVVEQYPAHSAEELMEWLKEENNLDVSWYYRKWTVRLIECSDECPMHEFEDECLMDALFQATCWVLEGKK